MTKEIINYETMSATEIAAFIGQSQNSDAFFGLPQLRINRMPDDDDGNKLTVGDYCLWDEEKEQMVYGPEARFRPLLQGFQYAIWDAEAGKYSSRSLIIRNIFDDEAIDTDGGVKCGKIPRSKQENLTDAEKDYQKKIRCYRLLYGLGSITGVNAKGKKAVVKDVPCLWRTSGTNFIPIGDAIKQITDQKKLMFNYELSLLTERKKSGGNIYYSVVPTVDFKNFIPLSDTDKEALQMFAETIAIDNTDVEAKFREATKLKTTDSDKMAEKFDNSGSLDAEFAEILDDPIPANL